MQPKCPTADEWIKKMYSLLQLKKKFFLKKGEEEKRKAQRKTGEMRKKRDCVLLHRETTPYKCPLRLLRCSLHELITNYQAVKP